MSQESSGDQAKELLEAINPIFKNTFETPFGLVKSSLYAGIVTIITNFQQNSPDEMTPELFGSLGCVLNKLGRYAEAVEAYQTAIGLDPDYAAAHGNLGYALIELGRYAEAEEALRTAIELDPDRAVTHGNLGYALNKLGRYAEAEEALRTAIKLDPNGAYIDIGYLQNELGYALKELGRYAEAEEALRTAIGLDPDYAVAQINLGYALTGLGRHDEAETACRRAIELDPETPYPRQFLAEISLRTRPDDTNAALSHLRDAFDRAGRNTKEPFWFDLYEIAIAASSSPAEAQKTLEEWSRPQDMAPA